MMNIQRNMTLLFRQKKIDDLWISFGCSVPHTNSKHINLRSVGMYAQMAQKLEDGSCLYTYYFEQKTQGDVLLKWLKDSNILINHLFKRSKIVKKDIEKL
jgi:hypothetical protein